MIRILCLGTALLAASPALADAPPTPMPAVTAIEAGDLALSAGFARATLPGAPVGGAYVTIANSGDQDDRLIGVSSSAARSSTLHQMQMNGDVMSMSSLPDGLPIPAGDSVVMGPSGIHIMLEGLIAPLEEGSRIDLTLTFERAGAVAMRIPVLAINAGAHAHHHH